MSSNERLKALKYVGQDHEMWPYDRYIVLGDYAPDNSMVEVVMISPHEDTTDGNPPPLMKYGLYIHRTLLRKEDIERDYEEDHEWPNPSE